MFAKSTLQRLNWITFGTFLALVTLIWGLPQPVEAKWLWQKNQNVDPEEAASVAPGATPPPPKDMIKAQCDPYLKDIQELNSHNRVARFFLKPQIGILKHKHYACLQSFMSQEKSYIETNVPKPENAEQLPKPTFEQLDAMIQSDSQKATGPQSTASPKNDAEQLIDVTEENP